jgi:hypothetical protein
MFKNRAMKRLFAPKKDEVSGGCRKLYNKELCNLYILPNIKMINSRIIRRGRACTTHGRDVLISFLEKHEGGRPFGRHRHGWENSIEKDLKE